MACRKPLAIAVAMVVVVTVAIYAGWRWRHDRPPFGPEALAITASLELTTNETAQDVLGKEVYPPPAQPGDQLVLGRVTWHPPPKGLAGGYFVILLIDKRTDLKPPVFGVTSPRPESVWSGGGGELNDVAERYPWLAGAGDRRGPNGWYSNGGALGASAADATPLIFVALFPAVDETVPPWLRVASAPVAVPDLLLAMVYIGGNKQIYWATRLAG